MFKDKKGKPVKKEVFYKRLRDHIQTVVTRYKDIIYAWDVVNEAIADDNMMFGPNASPYRQSTAFKLCGDELYSCSTTITAPWIPASANVSIIW